MMDRSLDVINLKEIEEFDLELWEKYNEKILRKWMGAPDDAPAASEPEAGGDDGGDDGGDGDDDDEWSTHAWAIHSKTIDEKINENIFKLDDKTEAECDKWIWNESIKNSKEIRKPYKQRQAQLKQMYEDKQCSAKNRFDTTPTYSY